MGGGVLIGLAALLLLGANGRVMGVSGVAGTLMTFAVDARARAHAAKEWPWRVAFIAGLVCTGAVLALATDTFAFEMPEGRSFGVLALAGLLVGYGTRAGLGCTSGHGICGLGRFSGRSLLATILFMAAGALVATLISWRMSL
jgi:uncharacterized membrane protein YedE/YeeE